MSKWNNGYSVGDLRSKLYENVKNENGGFLNNNVRYARNIEDTTKLQKEIERLQRENDDLKSTIADYQETVSDYQDELKRKDNIIKELKEKINQFTLIIGYYDYNDEGNDEIGENNNLQEELLNIINLDKIKELEELENDIK